jgi:hypothetical protein
MAVTDVDEARILVGVVSVMKQGRVRELRMEPGF